ncbi:holo-ACP synthase [Gardnerella vaginalis]|uniref:holo-ACP synthase n=1 Tax=Gardnerella vaginalis TaxID=2702 RepID=UPI000ED21305|nr:endonuclease [Bifidobacteriaceae bacterium NR015]
MIAGIGHDLVNVAQFAEQMQDGNGWRALFSVRELRQCDLRAQAKNDEKALHIAARWAGKEAVIKAWSEALSTANISYPYTLDNMPWASIEILNDSHGCPRVILSADVHSQLVKSLLSAHSECVDSSEHIDNSEHIANSDRVANIRWHISLSHDGLLDDNSAFASSVVMLEVL